MEQFVTIVKPSTLRAVNIGKEKRRATLKHNPYCFKRSEIKAEGKRPEKPLTQLQRRSTPSANTLTKHLLNTLSDESNPITHSDIGDHADRVTSTSTGHQVSDGCRSRRLYLDDRKTKIANQMEGNITSDELKVLHNVRVYINGFLSDTTDIEMKRIVSRAGGQIMSTATDATHILTSQQLSASKTHKVCMAKSRNLVHVVRPEWVTDSIESGKRRPERDYSIIRNTNTKSLLDMFQK